MSGRPAASRSESNTDSVEQQHSRLVQCVRSRWPEEDLALRMWGHSVGPFDLAAERFRAGRAALSATRRARTSGDTHRHA